MKIAIMTDSNSSISQDQAKNEGIFVLPMPFSINGVTKYEDIDFTQEEFYDALEQGVDISTSQPAVGEVLDFWDKLLQEYDAVVHMPMSSALSSSYQTAAILAQEYDGKVQVVDNQRIATTLAQAARQAKEMVSAGYTPEKIKEVLESTKKESSIYITLETLKYLKKGGRITPAAAAIGELLRLKPVLQIQGGKLDAFSKARTKKVAKAIMVKAVRADCLQRFATNEAGKDMDMAVVYSGDNAEALEYLEEMRQEFPEAHCEMAPLSLSVACHIGPGSIALTCAKHLKIE